MDADGGDDRASGSRARTVLKLSLILFGLLLGALAVAAWHGGGGAELPFEYEGFD